MTKPQELFKSLQLGTGATSIFEYDGINKIVIKNLAVVNTNGASRTFSLWLVPVGMSTANSYALALTQPLSAVGVAGYKVDNIGRDLVILPRYSIWGLASAATSVTLFGSGLEVS